MEFLQKRKGHIMHIKENLFILSLLALLSSPCFAEADEADEAEAQTKAPTKTNFSGLYQTYSIIQYPSEDDDGGDSDLSSGAFGIEVGASVDGEATSGAIFWYLERPNHYGLKLGFNIGSTADVEADLSNLGGILRNSDEFGQFTMNGIWLFRPLDIPTGVLGGMSYTELGYDTSSEVTLDDGGILAAKLGVIISSNQFNFTNEITGTVGYSLAFEHRKIVGDLSNNDTQINTIFSGNDTSYSGISAQIDINLSTNQRYFVKLTNFNDADGLSGLDGTQVSVGIKIDGILVD